MITACGRGPALRDQGKYWQFHVKDNVLPDIGVGKMTVPYQRPHPPIMLPSMSRGSASSRLAARRGWHMISANFVPKDIAIGHWRDLAGARALGLPPEPAKYRAGRTLLVCDTDEEAQAYLKHPGHCLEWYFKYIIGLTGHGGFVGMLKHDPTCRTRGDARLLHRVYRHRRQPAHRGRDAGGIPREGRTFRDADYLPP